MGEEQHKWISKLFGFDFEIKYKPGIENKAADALSRRLHYSSLSTVQFFEWEDIANEVNQDEKLKGIIQDLVAKTVEHKGYQLKNGKLYYKGRLVLPRTSTKIELILQEFHDSCIGGHSGYFRTFKRIANLFFWEGMRKTIQDYVSKCEICQKNKYQALNPAGLLQPLPIPKQIWTDVSMDFIGGLPKAGGMDTIFVVVDRLTKYAHFVALAHPYTAKEVAEVFLKEVVRLHGFPESIVSDRDRIFISSFWTELFKLAGTKLKFSSAYHPQTDGQTEVVNRCLETYLRCMTGSKPKQWHKWLTWAEFWYNTNYHAATKMTPFKALYGRDPPPVFRGDAELTNMEEVAAMTQDRNEILHMLKDHLVQAQNRMRQQANQHRRAVNYKVGDKVYLKIQPYKLKKLAKRVNQKLSPRYYGPYEILDRIGEVAYKLKLPDDSRVHPVFHVSLLKPTVTDDVVVQPLPPYVAEDLELQSIPEEVLAIRGKNREEAEVLIKWKNLPTCENSWELVTEMQEHFPELHLEDKVNFEGDGIDENITNEGQKGKITKVYERGKWRKGHSKQKKDSVAAESSNTRTPTGN